MRALAAPVAGFRPSATSKFSAPTVDAIMLEERAAAFTKRSIKTSAKLSGLKMVVNMCDLTTLEGKDTPGKVAYLCRKALQPAEAKYNVAPCAAVCVYPNLTKYARKFLGENSPVRVAVVATGFPSGQYPLRTSLGEVRRAVADGADEIDMVINRCAFLDGDHAKVFDAIAATKEVCDPAHLKVILETGELVSYDNVRLASEIAMQAGADFIKTSTGNLIRNNLATDYAVDAGAAVQDHDLEFKDYSHYFQNYPQRDLRLRAGCPAIDTGSPVSTPTSDIMGLPRPLDGDNNGQVGWDLGAHEFVHPTADSDGDGMSDAEELTAGTSPIDPKSVLRMNLELNPPGEVRLVWSSVKGRSYTMLTRNAFTNDASSPWAKGVWWIGTGDLMSETRAMLPGDSGCFQVWVKADGPELFP